MIKAIILVANFVQDHALLNTYPMIIFAFLWVAAYECNTWTPSN